MGRVLLAPLAGAIQGEFVSKLYWVFIVGFCALLGYAAATGNFGIIPKLPFDLPFGRQAQPTANVLNAPLIYPQMTGSVGISAAQLVKRFELFDAEVTWERSSDERGWIMRYTMPVELTGEMASGAGRFNYLADAARAGVSGPGFHVVGWAEDGYTLNANEITMLLGNAAAAMYQDGQVQ